MRYEHVCFTVQADLEAARLWAGGYGEAAGNWRESDAKPQTTASKDNLQHLAEIEPTFKKGSDTMIFDFSKKVAQTVGLGSR